MKKAFVLILSLLLMIQLLFPMMNLAVSAQDAVLFVSPSGNDSDNGSISSPLATIQGAKEKLRELKAVKEEPYTVYLREGMYYVTDELVFDSADMQNVHFCAYENEAVTVSGALPITGFTEETVNGVRAYTKQLDASADTFETLYHPTKTIDTPRYPESGAFAVKDVDEADNLFTEETTYWEVSRGNTSFNASLDDIKVDFSRPTDMYVRVLHRWIDEISHVTAYEKDIGKVRFARPATCMIETGDEYWFENVFEALDSPGEWYLDSAAMKLYYIPFEGETAESTVLYAPQTERLITIDGCNGISFEKISFRNTEWTLAVPPHDGGVRDIYNIDAYQAGDECDAAFFIQNADNISFKNCDFIGIGNSAVKIVKNVHDSAVTDCYFDNIGSGAVVIQGVSITEDAENSSEIMSGIRVSNNYISNYGQNTYESVGIHLKYARDSEISNNNIHNGYYTAISVGWIWSHDYQVTRNIQVKDNLIYNIGQGWLGDLGGIYTLGEQKGTVLSGNVIYNVICGRGQTCYGGNGIYTDAGSSFLTIENNLIYDCTANGINIGGCNRENIVHNNIVAFCAQSQFNPGEGEDFYSDDVFIPSIATNNIFVSDNAPVILDVTRGAFTESSNLLWDTANGIRLFFSDGYNGNLPKARKVMLLTAILNGFTRSDVIADPIFTDADSRDFSLAENSPAYKIGFEPWELKAGILSDSTVGVCARSLENIYSQANDLSAYPKACSNFTACDELREIYNDIYVLFWRIADRIWLKIKSICSC